MKRDRDFFKFRKNFLQGRHQYHKAATLIWNKRTTKNYTCFCGWEGNDLYIHFLENKPLRDIYKPML